MVCIYIHVCMSLYGIFIYVLSLYGIYMCLNNSLIAPMCMLWADLSFGLAGMLILLCCLRMSKPHVSRFLPAHVGGCMLVLGRRIMGQYTKYAHAGSCLASARADFRRESGR